MNEVELWNTLPKYSTLRSALDCQVLLKSLKWKRTYATTVLTYQATCQAELLHLFSFDIQYLFSYSNDLKLIEIASQESDHTWPIFVIKLDSPCSKKRL